MNRMFLLSVALVISIFTSLQAFAVSQDLPIVLDPAHLDLASVNALVTDAKTGEVLFANRLRNQVNGCHGGA
jgi:D-alanyl-D-alanine carboxypeptidase